MKNKWISADEIFSSEKKCKAFALASENYRRNTAIGLSSENTEKFHGQDMLIFQSSGTFPQLMFGKVPMSGVCCEVMAAYNALAAAGINADFFRLSAEFEVNAAMRILGLAPKGTWGSDPFLIGNCLDAYGADYIRIDAKAYKSRSEACAVFDAALKCGKSGIISYKWGIIKGHIHLGIHTYAAVYDGGCAKTFNRYGNFRHSADYPSAEASLKAGKYESRYLTGYIIK